MAKPLSVTSERLWRGGEVPDDWKKAEGGTRCRVQPLRHSSTANLHWGQTFNYYIGHTLSF